MVTFGVVLRSGGDYDEEDAICLSRQVSRNMLLPHRFVCLSDIRFEDPYIDVIPLKKNWPGWWSVIEIFRLTGPIIFMGLDTILLNSIDRLGELALTCPPNVFYMVRPQPRARRRGQKLSSGIMMWTGDWKWLFREFKPEYMKHFKGEERYTEWQMLKKHIDVRFTQDYFNGFYSYKNDIRDKRMPKDATVIAFHGKPRPRDCTETWAIRERADLSVPVHSLHELAMRKDDLHTDMRTQ